MNTPIIEPQTALLQLIIDVDQAHDELHVIEPYRLQQLQGGLLTHRFLRDWLQVALIPQYHHRENKLTKDALLKLRNDRKREYQDPKEGLTKAYRHLRAAPGDRLVFLKNTDGTYASRPQDVDRLFTKTWCSIYQGTPPLHGDPEYVEEFLQSYPIFDYQRHSTHPRPLDASVPTAYSVEPHTAESLRDAAACLKETALGLDNLGPVDFKRHIFGALNG